MGFLKAVTKPEVRGPETARVAPEQKRTPDKPELTSAPFVVLLGGGLRVPGWSLLGSVYIPSLFRTRQENYARAGNSYSSMASVPVRMDVLIGQLSVAHVTLNKQAQTRTTASASVAMPWKGGGLRVENKVGSGTCQRVPGQAGIAAEAAIFHLSGPMEMEEDS